MPSPNMPTLETAIVYPGMCLVEGTNLSEGRGTTRPFELFGAPYVDAVALREELTALDLPGVRFRLASFEPTFQKWARQEPRAAAPRHRPRALPATADGRRDLVGLSSALRGVAWRVDAYEFVDDILAIDLLYLSASTPAIDGGEF